MICPFHENQQLDLSKQEPPPPPAAGAASTSPATTAVTRAQALSGLKTMEIRGRRARIFELTSPPSIDEDSFNQLSAASVEAGSTCASVAAAIGVEGATNFDVLFDAAVEMSTSSPGTNVSTGAGALTANAGRSGPGVGDGESGGGEHNEKKAGVGALMHTLEEGASSKPPRVGPLQWEWLPRVEADSRARKLYREAAHAQVSDACGGDDAHCGGRTRKITAMQKYSFS